VPIPSTFTNAVDVTGTIVDTDYNTGFIYANISTGVQFSSQHLTVPNNIILHYSFTYVIK